MQRDKSNLMAQEIPEDAWVKSSFSGNGSGSDCVEIGKLAGGRAIRDSKNPAGGDLRFTEDQMTAFLLDVKAGKFDI
ncbi:DUF397 domain-containing protein [Actinacidiphila sp. ITFR-21]|uniref:DUF397 domain-containing protein n=1 Tax=Actinacidiphila sp. ITFR-21 TaxID=3075199 RepID=UPI00288A6FE1|nr:DUF397 domain-containing protein [Streptomyces sp. ITFR-21]WNI17650.1 DUF397 domain-containing protein [Streptomyces sp. ITFR-21]WNI17790.1 DUF397 domain-containing protein [Streptomyces sp. ITFR-21]